MATGQLNHPEKYIKSIECNVRDRNGRIRRSWSCSSRDKLSAIVLLDSFPISPRQAGRNFGHGTFK